MKTAFLSFCAVGVLGVSVWLPMPGVAQETTKGRPDAAPPRVLHVDAPAAAKLVADKKVAVLDIRTPKEFAAGHIAGATNLDFYATDFEQRLDELDKHRTWLVHCASGVRSTKSLASLQKLQFPSVVHLDGGFNAWKKAGEPIAK